MRLAQVLASTRAQARPGMRLFELEDHVQRALAQAGLSAANREVLGFRYATSFGLNAVIGGLQTLDARLVPGDVLTVDVAARDTIGGLVDAAISFCVDDRGQEMSLCAAAEVATRAGIAAIRPGTGPLDVLVAIRATLLGSGMALAPMAFLHGIGESLHAEPFAEPDAPGSARFEPGMILAVEPILMSAPGRLAWDTTGWEVSTSNGCATAFVEHTVVVTETGTSILTESGADG